jgi:hypothetical protein
LSQNPEDEPKIIGMSENLVTVLPLMETVELTLSIGEKIRRKEFHEAFSLRDYGFRVGYETYNKTVNQLSPKPKVFTPYFNKEPDDRDHSLWCTFRWNERGN